MPRQVHDHHHDRGDNDINPDYLDHHHFPEHLVVQHNDERADDDDHFHLVLGPDDVRDDERSRLVINFHDDIDTEYVLVRRDHFDDLTRAVHDYDVLVVNNAKHIIIAARRTVAAPWPVGTGPASDEVTPPQ